mgnify:CR=1 FL=1
MERKFSIVIPIAPWRNPEILKSIKKLDYPKKSFEVIVEKGTNPSENRNNGVKKAKGEYTVFLDDDATIEKDYLKKIENFFKEYPEADIVGGPQLTPEEKGFFARISGIVLTSIFGAFTVRKRYSKGKDVERADETLLTSANWCEKKGIYEKIGGFDKRLFPGEDPERISRAKKNNLNIFYNPEMIIYHRRRQTFFSFCKQFFKYGLVRPKKEKIAGETRFIFLIPMLFTIYFMFLPFLSAINLIFLIPIFFYIILAVLFSIIDSIKNKTLSALPILPFLYLLMHLSYGFGMAIGYLKK